MGNFNIDDIDLSKVGIFIVFLGLFVIAITIVVLAFNFKFWLGAIVLGLVLCMAGGLLCSD